MMKSKLALLLLSSSIIVAFSPSCAVAEPIEQQLVQTRLMNYTLGKDLAEINSKVEATQEKLRRNRADDPNQKVKARIIFSKALDSQKITSLASEYGFEVLQVEFTTFDRSNDKYFTSGFFNLETRFEESLSSKLQYFEDGYLEKLSDRMKKGWTPEELKSIDQDSLPYFSMVVYGTSRAISEVVEASEVKYIPYAKDVQPEEYRGYQLKQQVWRDVQERQVNDVPVATLQGGGEFSLPNGNSPPIGPNLQSASDLPVLDTVNKKKQTKATLVKFRAGVEKPVLSLLGDTLFNEAPGVSKTNKSLPSFSTQKIAALIPSAVPCNALTTGEKGCPNTSYWSPTKGSLGVAMRVTQYQSGLITGYAHSYIFNFSDVSAFSNTGYVPCVPQLPVGISRNIGSSPCLQSNSVYVQNAGYEHEALISNPNCKPLTLLRTGFSDPQECFVLSSGFSNLPPALYLDTPYADTGSPYSAALGTSGGQAIKANTNYEVNNYEVNVNFQAVGETAANLNNTNVLFFGQISTDFPQYSFGAGLAFSQFSVNKNTLGSLKLTYCESSCPPPVAFPAYPRDSRYVGRRVPQTVISNQTYAVTLGLQNNGTTETWSTSNNYKLGADPNYTVYSVDWGTGNRVALPASVVPGGRVDVKFNIKTPSTSGKYPFQFRMLQENVEWFGDASNLTNIKVTSAGGGYTTLPGKGTDIGIGSSGSTWLIGSIAEPSGTGYGIYYWNGSSWAKVSGAAVRVAVAPDGTPWVVNNAGTIFKRVNGAWQSLPGAAKDIAIGSTGSIWQVGTIPVNGGFSVHYWSGSSWIQVSGGAVRIAVAPDGNPWIVNDAGVIFRRANNSWQQLPGSAKDIGIGADGSVWIVGKTVVNGNYGMYQWNGSSWIPVYGIGTSVSVAPDGTPWVINSSQGISRRN